MKRGRKRGMYCAKIEEDYPGYLHSLYRQATKQKKVGAKASFVEIAKKMQELSVNNPNGPALELSRKKVRVWAMQMVAS